MLAEHLAHPVGLGHVPFGAHSGAAGGAPCGDLITIALKLQGTRVVDAGFAAHGCGTALAAGSAAVALVRDAPLLEAASIGTRAIAAELGGLSPGKLHAAELAADALHQALGAAARAAAELPHDPDRVLVAMSGGVDSAVAALLSGPHAVAVTLELWRDPEHDAAASCCSASAVRAARAMAHAMGLPHLTLDLRAEFRAGVVDPWLADHVNGETPNPCVRCNGAVRLDAMVALAARLGAGGGLATGHYARKDASGALRSAADAAKDQAYMLAAVGPATLGALRFPLGELTKPQVRELAARAGLAVADKRDSQDLCFLAGIGKSRFLARELGRAPGPLVRDGEVVGAHADARAFTVGQRRGHGISAPDPLFVTRVEGAEVHVGALTDLATRRVALRDLSVRSGAHPDRVRLRYRSEPLACRLEGDTVVLEEEVTAAAPGQVAVLYRGDVVVGHGVIARVAALTLVVLALLAGSAQAAPVTESAAAGELSATLSYDRQGSTMTFSKLRVRIERGGAAEYDSPIAGCDGCRPAEVYASPPTPSIRWVDLDRDGSPELVVDLYTGGAHCCAIAQVLERDPVSGAWAVHARDFADRGYELRDVDGDGVPEWLTGDSRLLYLFAPYAFSEVPIAVLHYDHGSYRDVTRAFPALIRADAAGHLSSYVRHRRLYRIPAYAALAAWVADERMLGLRARARAHVRAEQRAGRLGGPRDPKGRRFVARLERVLRSFGYR